MLLYVMRHGPAEDRAPSGRDFDRQLTPQGRAVVARAAEALRGTRASDLLPRVLASPLLRAAQTAEIVRGIACDPRLVVESRTELATDEPIPTPLVAELARCESDALLVGHQPTVEDLVRSLVTDASLLRPGFRTGMIAILRPGERGWSLERVLDPHG